MAMNISKNNKYDWLETTIYYGNYTVGVIFLNTINEKEIKAFFRKYNFNQIISDAKSYILKQSELVSDLSADELKDFNDIYPEGINIYIDSFEIYFNDCGVFGRHMLVATYSLTKNKFISYNIEG